MPPRRTAPISAHPEPKVDPDRRRAEPVASGLEPAHRPEGLRLPGSPDHRPGHRTRRSGHRTTRCTVTPGTIGPVPMKPPRYQACSSSPRTSPRSGRHRSTTGSSSAGNVPARRAAPVGDRRPRRLPDPPRAAAGLGWRSGLADRPQHERDPAQWAADRAIPYRSRIMPGDRVRLGSVELQFRSRRFVASAGTGALETVRQISIADMVMVVGDIIAFSSIAEYTDDFVLLENIDRLYAELRQVLSRHHGTLSNYIGDAFFATWETAATPDAAGAAVAFAVEAAELVPRIAAGLGLRISGRAAADGLGVSCGPAAVSLMTGMLVSVLGDTTNVAFRLSGIAGRDGPAGHPGDRRCPPRDSGELRLHPAAGHPGQGPHPGGRGTRREPLETRPASFSTPQSPRRSPASCLSWISARFLTSFVTAATSSGWLPSTMAPTARPSEITSRRYDGVPPDPDPHRRRTSSPGCAANLPTENSSMPSALEDTGRYLRGERLVAAERVHGGDLPLLGRDRPQPEDQPVVLRDISGREYPGRRCRHPVVDHDSAVDRDAGVPGQFDVGPDPDGGEEHLAGQLPPVLEATAVVSVPSPPSAIPSRRRRAPACPMRAKWPRPVRCIARRSGETAAALRARGRSPAAPARGAHARPQARAARRRRPRRPGTRVAGRRPGWRMASAASRRRNFRADRNRQSAAPRCCCPWPRISRSIGKRVTGAQEHPLGAQVDPASPRCSARR